MSIPKKINTQVTFQPKHAPTNFAQNSIWAKYIFTSPRCLKKTPIPDQNILLTVFINEKFGVNLYWPNAIYGFTLITKQI